MENLPRLIAAYQAMDQRGREETVRHVERLAKAHPRQGSLRLVASDGRVKDLRKVVSVPK